ncbi:LysE family translocator [Solirhodobacter olei]|uniref:LysE family translocator n=1 Tax=Solirhodobacter olei TaxID=2493082 RepID=UPI000FD7BC48|nr:LysE family translocator [Solirhodobacter olei]
MTLASLLIFASTLAVVAAAPGPSIAALVARTVSRGPREVLPFVAAMWVGEAIWISCTVWGLTALAHHFQTAFLVLKWAGAAYLLVLAWKMWHAPTELGTEALPERARPLRMFAAGLAVTLGNPKIMVFYLALVPTLIDLSHVGLGGWAALTTTAVSVLVAVDLSWLALATRARRLLRNPRALKVANRMSAGIMAGAAGLIAAR